MRKLVVLVLAGLVAVSACAPKIVPAPIVTTPKFPGFLSPVVPPALAGSRAALSFDRGWRFLQAGDLKNADHEFALALQASAAFYPAETGSGYVALARKDAKTALSHFDRALERQPADPSGLVGRGEALLALEREGEAVAAFEAAVTADPSLNDLRRRVEVLKFRGVERGLADARQAARSGNVDEAIRSYQEAIAGSPDSAFLYRELAVIERQKGDTDDALVHFRKAVSLDPADASSFAQLGELLEERGDLDGAVEAYNSSLAVEPNEATEGRLAAIRTRMAIARLPEEYRALDASPQITRADLAALIGVRLASLLQTIRPVAPVLLTDVRNHWAENWIMAVTGTGVMDVNPNHAFQPGALVRRTDLAQVISRLLPRLTSAGQLQAWQNARIRFSDLVPTHLAYSAASLAVVSGVLTAEEGKFQPSGTVTGAEAIAAIDRLERMANIPPRPGAR